MPPKKHSRNLIFAFRSNDGIIRNAISVVALIIDNTAIPSLESGSLFELW
jgi:hypothetical protein